MSPSDQQNLSAPGVSDVIQQDFDGGRRNSISQGPGDLVFLVPEALGIIGDNENDHIVGSDHVTSPLGVWLFQDSKTFKKQTTKETEKDQTKQENTTSQHLTQNFTPAHPMAIASVKSRFFSSANKHWKSKVQGDQGIPTMIHNCQTTGDMGFPFLLLSSYSDLYDLR